MLGGSGKSDFSSTMSCTENGSHEALALQRWLTHRLGNCKVDGTLMVARSLLTLIPAKSIPQSFGRMVSVEGASSRGLVQIISIGLKTDRLEHGTIARLSTPFGTRNTRPIVACPHSRLSRRWISAADAVSLCSSHTCMGVLCRRCRARNREARGMMSGAGLRVGRS
jgi:hypothetical protein